MQIHLDAKGRFLTRLDLCQYRLAVARVWEGGRGAVQRAEESSRTAGHSLRQASEPHVCATSPATSATPLNGLGDALITPFFLPEHVLDAVGAGDSRTAVLPARCLPCSASERHLLRLLPPHPPVEWLQPRCRRAVLGRGSRSAALKPPDNIQVETGAPHDAASSHSSGAPQPLEDGAHLRFCPEWTIAFASTYRLKRAPPVRPPVRRLQVGRCQHHLICFDQTRDGGDIESLLQWPGLSWPRCVSLAQSMSALTAALIN